MAQGYERVYAEYEYWGGPVGGVANVDGVACYFLSRYVTEELDTETGEYFVWPVGRSVLDLEIERYRLLSAWIHGSDGRDSPGPVVSSRHEELDDQLASHRCIPQDCATRVASWAYFDVVHYRLDGPGYLVRWNPESSHR
ncbi:hypothetical protein LK09_14855 [Microbacterium mangrovi]|uniref:Uncharacterized protein n=2 Tax=Microbacterium mangrovi TaxID=1348253 RepID=A0A0B1ZZE3_9MICO|nr:hypothetical protein LK09_14855 [Microbacterium mangrovi]